MSKYPEGTTLSTLQDAGKLPTSRRRRTFITARPSVDSTKVPTAAILQAVSKRNNIRYMVMTVGKDRPLADGNSNLKLKEVPSDAPQTVASSLLRSKILISVTDVHT